MILVIDNYDSFVHNLARYVRRICDQPLDIIRNDESVLDDAHLRPSAIIISPGPCGPGDSGKTLEIIRRFCETTPILGVCLGHQAIFESFGGNIVRARTPMHGRSSLVHADPQSPLFAGIPSPFAAGRYHSLVGDTDSTPPSLKKIAWTDDGTLMAVEHRSLPVFGVQFHPESILTEYGIQILYNYLRLAGANPTLPPEMLEAS
jgi:anthranilate synthase/aminodeoxychorismate synthase-like glutamine amidotransferase